MKKWTDIIAGMASLRGGSRNADDKRSGLSAFTLVELLMVMVVIMILVGISLPVARYVTRRMVDEKERMMGREIRDALDAYRMAFGEYPITPPNPGYERHYSIYSPECEYFSTPMSFHDGTKETLDLTTADSAVPNIDYVLTYPLMLGPRQRGEPPYMRFEYVVIARALVSLDAEFRHEIERVDPRTGERIEGYGLLPVDIERPVALVPTTQKQWRYYSSDGQNYVLCPGGDDASSPGCDNPGCLACYPPS